jgi:hypothetical protein
MEERELAQELLRDIWQSPGRWSICSLGTCLMKCDRASSLLCAIERAA